MNDNKKPISTAGKIGIGIAIVALIAGAFVMGNNIGFDKGLKIGRGWK